MSASTLNRWAVIAGGGTAGHVLPAIAIGRELLRRGLLPEQVLFIGSRRGLEARLLPQAGLDSMLLPGRGIQRKFSLQNITSAFGIFRACHLALRELIRHRPAVIASVGGYASFPAVLASVVLRIPLVVVEQNARAGVANKFAGRFAKAAATAFDATGLPRATLTGNPVEHRLLELAETDPDVRKRAARDALGISEQALMVSAFGGSLGARSINMAIINLVRLWATNSDVFIYHIAGERDFDDISRQIETLRGEMGVAIGYRLVRYEDRMDLVYSATDVCVCRAGATSIADLAVMGVPSVLVPLPSAAEDHQTINARGVVRDGGALLIPDAELTGKRLAADLMPLLIQPSVLTAMAAGQRSRAMPNAAASIADLLELHAQHPLKSDSYDRSS
jgi:UDP-N-acetylglucosamine--N-acetylmuramyl-(pentapeptide) pyrophosphoryl-undecaprenol N-acetylglucosamine transferase